jgi:hypothetical protein
MRHEIMPSGYFAKPEEQILEGGDFVRLKPRLPCHHLIHLHPQTTFRPQGGQGQGTVRLGELPDILAQQQGIMAKNPGRKKIVPVQPGEKKLGRSLGQEVCEMCWCTRAG